MSTRAVGAATVLAAIGAVVIIAIAAWDSRGGSHGGDGGAFVVERAPAETATPARGYANGAARPATTVRVPSPHRPVLVALYEATRGEFWLDSTHWLSDRPVGDWYGVSTDGVGRVTSLRLSGNRLRGPLPPEIGNLVVGQASARLASPARIAATATSTAAAASVMAVMRWGSMTHLDRAG